MGNLEKLLVVGVLVVVIAILAISLFWTGDVATLPEVGKDSVAIEGTFKSEAPLGDLGLPGDSLPLAGTGGGVPAALSAEPPVGVTPLLMNTQPSPTGSVDSAVRPGEENFRTYVIQRGDTLEAIAQRELGSKAKVGELLKANEGLEPKKLKVGHSILIPRDAGSPIMTKTPEPKKESPGTDKPASYTVQKGDTLWKISKKVYGDGARWKKIFEGNKDKLAAEDSLKVGMTLSIP